MTRRVQAAAAQLRAHNDQLVAQVERLKQTLAAAEGQVQMLQGQNDELKWLLDACAKCGDCRYPDLLRQSIATSVMGPLLRMEIRTAIAEKENHEGCQAQSLPDCSTSR